jgi:hypothetical protein
LTAEPGILIINPYSIMRASLSTGLWALLFMAVGLLGCESEHASTLAPEARHAVEVLPPGARFVGMVDFQQIQRNSYTSPFGQGAFSLGRMPGNAGEELQAFAEETGIDLEHDLHRAYMASDGDNDNVSFVLYARFDNARLRSFLEDRMGSVAEMEDYRGVTVFRNRRGSEGAFALVGDEVVLASPRMRNVEAMIDRHLDQEKALKDDDAMMALIEQARNGSGWLVMKGLDFSESPGPAADKLMRETAQIGRAVQDVIVSTDVTAEGFKGHAILVPKSGVSSDDLAALLKGMVAAVKLRPDLDDRLLRALDDVRVRSHGEDVTIEFSVENATLAAW